MNTRTIRTHLLASTPGAALALIAIACTAPSAHAAVSSVSGQATLLGSPPLACTIGPLAAPNAYVWNEQTNVFSTATFLDETQNPGGSASPISGILGPALYDSHFIHFDSSSGVNSASGTVTFSQPIVGAIFVNNSLDISDATFGAFGTVYPTGYGFRNLSLSSFSYTGNVLTFNFLHMVPTIDISQIRVITHSVPAPAAGALGACAGVLALRRRRRA